MNVSGRLSTGRRECDPSYQPYVRKNVLTCMSFRRSAPPSDNILSVARKLRGSTNGYLLSCDCRLEIHLLGLAMLSTPNDDHHTA